MNKILKYLLPCAFLGAIFTGCNDIAPDDRFIDVPPVEGDRVVILEDYTGQSCPNCPEGARIIEQLKQQYGDRLIPVSIHAGNFAFPADQKMPVGLMQPFGNDMAKDRNVETYPAAAVDGKSPLERGDWAAAVRDAMAVPSTCDITFSPLEVVELPDGSATINGSVTLLSGKTCSALLGVWLVEDGIVAWQFNVNDDHRWTTNYIHNHVLRSYFGANYFGNPISLEREESKSARFSFQLDDSWNPENLSVIAFVKDGETGRYMQSGIVSVSTAQ